MILIIIILISCTKCAKLVVKRGKLIEEEGIKLPDGTEINYLGKGDSYTSISVFWNEFKRGDMKKELTKEYFRRVREILQSKLDGVMSSVG